MPFLETDGANVYYETWSIPGGRWVTLINGHTRSLDDFRFMIPALNRAGLSVLALDNRGCGKTETQRKFSLMDIAKDVRAIWKALGVRSSDVVGLSMGGAVSLILAAEPDTGVGKLALVSTTASWNLELPDVTSGTFLDDIAKYFSPVFFEKQKSFILHFGKEVQKQAKDPAKIQGIVWQREAVEGLDLTSKLSKVHRPTLVIHGDEDLIIPFDSAELLHRKIAGSVLRTLPGVGHLPLAQCPKLLFDEVAGFLTSRGE